MFLATCWVMVEPPLARSPLPILLLVTRRLSTQMYTRTRDNQEALGAMSAVVAISHDMGGLTSPAVFWIPILVRSSYFIIGVRAALFRMVRSSRRTTAAPKRASRSAIGHRSSRSTRYAGTLTSKCTPAAPASIMLFISS